MSFERKASRSKRKTTRLPATIRKALPRLAWMKKRAEHIRDQFRGGSVTESDLQEMGSLGQELVAMSKAMEQVQEASQGLSALADEIFDAARDQGWEWEDPE